MKRRLSFKPVFSATVLTLFIFVSILSFLSFVVYLFIKELTNLYYDNIGFFKDILDGFNFLDVLKGLSVSDDMMSTISNTAFAVVRIIPISITLLIITFVFTIFLINNISALMNSVYSKLSTDKAQLVKTVVSSSKTIISKFFKSYLILYFITFLESVFIFMLIGIDYPLVLAFVTAIADILPILGPGTVYIPISAVFILNGDIFSGITLLVFWAIVIIIRQIIEPKIVSDSVKIHPLVIFSALYFSIVSSNIWVLFYVIIFSLVYNILIMTNVLTPIFKTNDK